MAVMKILKCHIPFTGQRVFDRTLFPCNLEEDLSDLPKTLVVTEANPTCEVTFKEHIYLTGLSTFDKAHHYLEGPWEDVTVMGTSATEVSEPVQESVGASIPPDDNVQDPSDSRDGSGRQRQRQRR